MESLKATLSKRLAAAGGEASASSAEPKKLQQRQQPPLPTTANSRDSKKAAQASDPPLRPSPIQTVNRRQEGGVSTDGARRHPAPSKAADPQAKLSSESAQPANNQAPGGVDNAALGASGTIRRTALGWEMAAG